MHCATQAPSSRMATLTAVNVAPFGLDRRHVAIVIDRLAPGPSVKEVTLDRNGEAAENQSSRRHLVNQGIEPIEQQIGVVGRLASHLDSFLQGDAGGIADGGRKRKSSLLKGRIARRADATDTDIGAVRKQLGMRFDRRSLGGLCHRSLHSSPPMIKK
jgi:hypothetical protein